MKYTDDEILNRLRAGDSRAFELIFIEHYRVLSMKAFYLLKNEMDAEDVVQTLFVDFWDKKLYTNVNSSLKAYLHTCIRNRCLNFILHRKVKEKNLEGYEYMLEKYYENPLIDSQQDSKKLNVILKQIPRKRMRAFSLVHIENKRYQDAADEMGISINSVKTHLKLAIKDLRQRIYNFE